jgi:thiazolinyl reductase component of yersiniabactin synthetase
MRLLLCGTNYGATYLRALHANGHRLQLAGILARSERSRELARQCAVPFFPNVEALPAGAIDAACVAIPGQSGRAITEALLGRGIHVLAEHPVSHADLLAHRAAARQHGVVYHVNAHYSDLDAPATFTAAFRAATERSAIRAATERAAIRAATERSAIRAATERAAIRAATERSAIRAATEHAANDGAGFRPSLLFVNLLTNPRTLYSALEILGRCLGPLQPPFTIVRLPQAPQAFFATFQLLLGSVAVTIQLQRASSAVDDGSANWVSHRIDAGFAEGVLTLIESQGPVLWLPAPPSLPELQADPAIWLRPLWRVLATPPPTFADFVNGARDRANRIALGRFARAIGTRIVEPEQSDEHLLGVSALWEALLT